MINSWSRSFGSFLLALLHLLYSAFLAVKLRLNRGPGPKPLERELSLLREEVTGFKKVPWHVGLVLGPESASYKDIVKIIEWCFPAGIRVISLYDYRNGIDPNAVFESVCELSKPSVQNIKWGKSFSRDIKEESKKQINGYLWKPKLTVNIFRREDGLESLLEAVVDLHESGVQNIDRDGINEFMLKRILSCGEPELAIVCGNGLSSYGLLPWHLRVTQFLSLDSHHDITVEKFSHLLQEYSNCEQRFGK